MKKLADVVNNVLLGSLLLACAGAACAEETISVWANKGKYKAEDVALQAVVDRFEKKTGIKVELSLFSSEDVATKSISAVSAGTPPDIGFGSTYNAKTTGKWAYEGKLEDVSAVLLPIKSRFLPGVVETTYLYNEKAKKKSYYAAPVQQQTMQASYWRDMLADAGYKDADIPRDWKGYWSFWCDKVQPALRKKGQRVYGIGHPSSVQASDTYQSFLTFATAYNVKMVDENGKLLLDDPKTRKGLELALTDYASVYQKGCTPPSSINWTNVDNNVNLHNRTTVMTHNFALSIPGSYLDVIDNPTATPEQKETARKKYYETLVTAPFPNKPDGSPMQNMSLITTAVVFAEAKNKPGAKKFLSFLLQEENLTPFVEGSLGSWFPVTKAGAERPFWTDPKDPHRSVTYKIFKDGTVPFQFVYNWKFSVVNAENVWGHAIARVTKDNISPAQATDEMIARIKTIVAN
jgi:multiple sugar transport system substrate-binding protein